MLWSHALARKCWAGNQSSVAACQSSQSAAGVPFFPCHKSANRRNGFQTVVSRQEGMSCVTLNSEFWATQTPSRRLCPLPRPSILGCLVASKLDSRQNTQFMTDSSIFIFFFCFSKDLYCSFKKRCVLCAATEVGTTSGSRSRRRRQPSCPRTSRCRKRRSRPSPERTNSSHRSQVGV